MSSSFTGSLRPGVVLLTRPHYPFKYTPVSKTQIQAGASGYGNITWVIAQPKNLKRDTNAPSIKDKVIIFSDFFPTLNLEG